jgi:hypothetical protein
MAKRQKQEGKVTTTTKTVIDVEKYDKVAAYYELERCKKERDTLTEMLNSLASWDHMQSYPLFVKGIDGRTYIIHTKLDMKIKDFIQEAATREKVENPSHLRFIFAGRDPFYGRDPDAPMYTTGLGPDNTIYALMHLRGD